MELHEGAVIPLRLVRDGAPTFLALAEAWLRTRASRLTRPGNVHRHVVHLRPLWRLTEAELRPAMIEELLLSLARPRGHLAAATANKVLVTGRSIVRFAEFNGEWHGRNPFELVDRLPQDRPQTAALDVHQARKLLPHLRWDRRLEILVMLYMGLRPGELKALQWSDVDLERMTLVVRRSNGWNGTKTRKDRALPIPEALRQVFDDAALARYPGSPLVFPGKEGRMQREDAKLSRMLQSALARAGIVSGWRYVCRRKGCGYRDERLGRAEARCPRCQFQLQRVGIPLHFRHYDLRHSCATLHRRAGADPLAIQILLGHAPESLTDSVYTHLTLEDVRREINKLRI